MRKKRTYARNEIRPSSLWQHPEPKKAPEPSAREMFRLNRRLLLASRPLLKPARVVKHVKSAPYVNAKGKTVSRSWTEEQQVPPVYGAPTFRNVIEDGVLK